MSGSGFFTLPDTHRTRAQLSSGFGDCTPFVDRFDSRKKGDLNQRGGETT